MNRRRTFICREEHSHLQHENTPEQARQGKDYSLHVILSRRTTFNALHFCKNINVERNTEIINYFFILNSVKVINFDPFNPILRKEYLISTSIKI